MLINKKSLALIFLVGTFLAMALYFNAIAAIDAPHNEASNDVGCGSCHGQGLLFSPFWGYDYTPAHIDDTPYNKICFRCHTYPSADEYTGIIAPLVQPHSDRSINGPGNEEWSRDCIDCHNPHYQNLKFYKNTDADNLYLAHGELIDCEHNGDGTSILTFSDIIYKTETGWDAAKLMEKTIENRRAILFPNLRKPGISYEIKEINDPPTSTFIIFDNEFSGSVCDYLPLPSNPTNFAVIYGQYIRNTIDISPDISGTMSQMKFFDKTGQNSFGFDESATGTDPTPYGICQVCHTVEANPDNPTHWRADGTGADHYNDNVYEEGCIHCHSHLDGFGHGGGGGEGCGDCHNSGNHVPHLDLSLNCDDCHDMNNMPNFRDGFDLENTAVCAECHKNGAGGDPNQTDYKTQENWDNGDYDLDCTGCHSKPPDYANGNPKANSHAAHNNYTCNNCHFNTTTDGEGITNLANHINNVYDVSPEGPVSFTYTYDSEGGTCESISCHGDTDAQWGVFACLNCHSVSIENRMAITEQFSANSHHVQGVELTSAHCYECHWEAGSDGSVNGTYHGGSASPGSEVNLVMYGDGERPTNYTEGTTAVLYTANGQRDQIREITTHCLSCHSDMNNTTVPFDDGKTPREYAWDNSSIDARYSQTGTTAWVRYGGDADVPIINESFEEIKGGGNDGYDEFSKEKKGSGATLDPEAGIPAPPPPGSGSQCLQSSLIETGGNQAYARRDLGLEITKTITSFYLNVQNAQDFSGDSYKNIVRLRNNKDNNAILFRLYDNAGQLQFNLRIFNDGGWQEYYYPAAGAISLDTWYEIEITYDNRNDVWEWKVDDISQDSGILIGNHRDGIQIWDIGFTGTGTGLTGTIYFDLISVVGHNIGNFTPKNNQTKAYSAHGNAINNQGGWDLNETWPNTRDGSYDIACFDCHNSHGSSVSGETTSYTSDYIGAPPNGGGILKDTEAGKGGYTMEYKPQEGGSIEDKNFHNAGAGLCFDCHMNATSGTTPWGYQDTFGATEKILGYRDTPYFGDSTAPPQQRFPYKALTLPGVPRVTGGHFGASAPLTSPATETIGGLCTPCHDPHGVSSTLEQEYAVPLLKGTWLTSFYKEDRAPANNVVGTIRTDRGREGLPYNIDQNTFGPDIGGTGIFIGETDTQFAGLCLSCHPKNNLTDGVNGGTWESIDRVHESVKDWGANVKHNYTCSKCHAPHNARLPRLMVTNCLDRRLKGRVSDNLSPILSGVGYGCSCCDNRLYLCEDTRCADGVYPFDGCPSTDGNIVCYDEAQELGYCPDTPKTHVISLKGQGSGSFPENGSGDGMTLRLTMEITITYHAMKMKLLTRAGMQ